MTVTNVWSLVVVRALMGISAGLILTATGGILVSTMHGTTRHDAWLLWRGAGMAGMVLGPVFGPLIASAPSWRRLFIADALLMLVAVGIGAHSMKETRDEDSVFTVALLLPTLLLGLGLLSPYLALLAAKEHLASWPLIAVIMVAGMACLLGFFVLNRRSSHLLFDTNIVVHNRRMWFTDLFGAIHVGALFVVVAAFPVILDADTDLSAAEIGVGMLALTIPLITLHLLAHRFREKYRLTRQKDIDRVYPHRAEHGVVVCCCVAAPDVCHGLAVAGPDGRRIRDDPPVWAYGSHQGTGQRWASTLFGTRTFSNHSGAAIGAIVIGFVLPATSMHVLSNDPQIAEQAGIVAGVAVALVVVSSAIFAAFKDEFLGLEDPHWHKSKAPSLDGQE